MGGKERREGRRGEGERGRGGEGKLILMRSWNRDADWLKPVLIALFKACRCSWKTVTLCVIAGGIFWAILPHNSRSKSTTVYTVVSDSRYVTKQAAESRQTLCSIGSRHVTFPTYGQ